MHLLVNKVFYSSLMHGTNMNIFVIIRVDGDRHFFSSCDAAVQLGFTGSFPGVKRPRRGVDHSPPLRANVKYE